MVRTKPERYTERGEKKACFFHAADGVFKDEEPRKDKWTLYVEFYWIRSMDSNTNDHPSVETLFALAEQANALKSKSENPTDTEDVQEASPEEDEICPECDESYLYNYTCMMRTCVSCGRCEPAYLFDTPLDQNDTYERCGAPRLMSDSNFMTGLKIDPTNTKSTHNGQRLVQMNQWGKMDAATRQHVADIQLLHTHNMEVSPSCTQLIKDYFSKRRYVRGSSRKAALAAICFWDKTAGRYTGGGGALRPSMFAKRLNIPVASVTDALRELETMIQTGELQVGTLSRHPTEEDVHLVQSNDPIDYMHQLCGKLNVNFCGTERHILHRIRRRSRELYERCKGDPSLEHQKPHTIMCAIVYLVLEEDPDIEEKKLTKKIPIVRSSLVSTCKKLRNILCQNP